MLFLFMAGLVGQVIKSSVVFNPLDQSSSAVESEEDADLKGPVVCYHTWNKTIGVPYSITDIL